MDGSMDGWRFRIVENGACHVMSTPAHRWGTIPTLSPFWLGSLLYKQRETCPKDFKHTFCPKTNSKSPISLENQLPTPEVSLLPLFKMDNSFLVRFGLFVKG